MRSIPTKTMIIKNSNPRSWFGTDYTMNIYKGCCHGCIYCDSRSSCYCIENFDEVRIKENSLDIIERELLRKRNKGVIGTGSMSDPYNPFEKKLNLTREALKILDKNEFGVSIATKSNLILRDIDILKKINSHSEVCTKITITTFDDELGKIIEPHVPKTSERFKVIEELSKNGIYTGILLMPILPFINDSEENIINIIEMAKECGAKFIYPNFGVTLRQNQREYFYNRLDENFKGLRKKYIERFGERYYYPSPNIKNIQRIFKNYCEKYNIKYNMEDIINDYKHSKIEQLKLF